MIKYLLVGIENGLFSEWEYHTIYWYMSILYAMSYEHLNEFRIQLDMDRRLYSVTKKSKNIKPNKTLPLTIDQHIIMLYRTLVNALTRFCLALMQKNVIQTPAFLFGKEMERYELRFSAFKRTNTPQYIPYEKYNEQKTNGLKSPTLVMDAINEFKKIKDMVTEIKQMNKEEYIPVEELDMIYAISMSNMLNAFKLMKCPDGNKMKATFTFTQSKHFPIIVLEQKQ